DDRSVPVPQLRAYESIEHTPISVARLNKPRDESGGNDFSRATGAVVAFDRDAKTLLRQRRAEHAFCAGLDEHPLAKVFHHFGAEASGTGNEPGLRRAGGA